MEEDGFSLVLSPAQLAAILSGATVRDQEPPSFWTRAWGCGKLIFGTLEEVRAGALWLAPEPTMLTKAGGTVFGIRGADTLQSGARQLWTGRDTPTLTQQGAAAAASALGADADSARAIGEGIDIAVPIVVSLGLGAARIIAVRSGRIVLAEHEAVQGAKIGGHTILEHVGKQDADLLARLTSKPWMKAASTFKDIREAETAVSEAVRINKAAIMRWLKTAATGDRQPFPLPMPEGVGRVMLKGATTSVPGKAVRLVLKKEAYQGKIWYVLTAFPEA